MDVEELVHVHGGEAGLRRERRGDRFAYRDGVDALLDLVNYAPGTYDTALKEGAHVASPTGAAGEGPGRSNVMATPTTDRGAAADHGPVGLDVGARIEQRVERLDVVAARGPVQRSLGVRTGEARVDVGAGGDQRTDLGGRLGDVAGPVGDDVQQGPGLTALAT